METRHQIYFEDSKKMKPVRPGAVNLVVTSPPYPMIGMWDEMFFHQDAKIKNEMKQGHGDQAFERMHVVLDKVWKEMWRVLAPGGIACINIGDATRTVDGNFQLFTNHSRIIAGMQAVGFQSLPAILWRKPTNAPNKFMGSGMLPGGAYVTLEHEYILVFRKGTKREVDTVKEKALRRESAYFWEERNNWFSDVWFGLIGTVQKMQKKNGRDRSGAYPFELAYRLISMYSLKGDWVLDPFLGSGTTTLAAMACGRNSIGFEIETGLEDTIRERIDGVVDMANERIMGRLKDHVEFVEERQKDKGPLKHTNSVYGFPVVTLQETGLFLNDLESVRQTGELEFLACHSAKPEEGELKITNYELRIKNCEPQTGGPGKKGRKSKKKKADGHLQQEFDF